MYDFIDVTESHSGNQLPSEALCFNGEWIENHVPGYRTLYVSGRELSISELKDIEVGQADGSRFQSKRYPSRIITVGYMLQAKGNAAFREAYNKLNAILDAEEAQLIFNDEPDKYYIGTKKSGSTVPPGKNNVTGEIEFYCADPFKYSVEEIEVIPELDNGKTFAIDYKGTYPASPALEVTFPSDCGYAAFTDKNENILQFGSPEEVDSVFMESEHLIADAMEAGISGWVLNKAVTTGTNEFKQTGSFKHTYRRESPCIEPNSYGDGTQWHGPSYTKQVPPNSAGEIGAKNCLYGWTHFFVVESNQDVGIAQFMMTGENGRNVAAITFYKNTVNNDYMGHYKISINDKVVYQDSYSLDSQNSLTSWENAWSYIEKFGDTITVKVGNFLVKSFRDAEIANVKVKEVSFYLGAYGNNKVGNNGVRRVRLTAHNVDTWVDIPNVFCKDDILEVDSGTGSVVLSHIQEPGLGALGNNWEDFKLMPGDNQIRCLYSAWAQKPAFKLKYREVYL